jgi:acetyltransferase-like isoleucine patch superfamily enzyme/acyl carrier protein
MSILTSDRRDVNPFDLWMTRRRLRAVSRVGIGARVKGRADIGGGGKIIIGDEFFLLSRPVRSHIFAAPGSVVTIGDSVQFSYGAAIAARQAIDIGDNTVFGPFVVIMDNDFHRVGNRYAAGEVAPVRIGSNVNVGARVTILRGSVIGNNVRVMSGGMVSGVVPNGVTIGGVPARVVVAHGATVGDSSDLAALVQDVLGLAEVPHHSEGPGQIPAWDSLGTLRLLLAIEEVYGVTLDEDEMRAANTVAALSDVVETKLSGPVSAAVDIAEPT